MDADESKRIESALQSLVGLSPWKVAMNWGSIFAAHYGGKIIRVGADGSVIEVGERVLHGWWPWTLADADGNEAARWNGNRSDCDRLRQSIESGPVRAVVFDPVNLDGDVWFDDGARLRLIGACAEEQPKHVTWSVITPDEALNFHAGRYTSRGVRTLF